MENKTELQENAQDLKEIKRVETGKDLKRATFVASIVFVGIWLIVLLVSSEKGAFGPDGEDADPLERRAVEERPAIPAGGIPGGR